MNSIDLNTTQMLNYLHRGGSWAYYFTLPECRSFWYPISQRPVIPQEVDVFFSVNPCGYRKRDFERGKVTDISAINCLFSDYDFKTGASLNDLDNFPIVPSVVVLSGGGFHAYWLLNEPTIVSDHNLAELASIQQRWVHLVGGDPSAKDLARVLRLPGSFNHKYDPARPVEFYYANFKQVYSVDQLAGYLPPEKEIGQKTDFQHVTSCLHTGEYWLERALRDAHPGNRNDIGFWLATQLRDEGLSLSEAKTIMKTYQERVTTDSDPYTLNEAWATCQSAFSMEPREPAARLIYSSLSEKVLQAQEIHDPIDKKQEIVKFISGCEKSDLGNAERFVALHGKDMHFLRETGYWVIWDGTRWKRDSNGEVERRAQLTAKSIYQEAYNERDLNRQKELSIWALTSQSRSRLDNMIDLAKSQVGITIPLSNFDKCQYLLNFLNGTVNLTNGKLQPHNRDDLITKQIPMNYDPNASCPTWLQFLDDVMNHKQLMIDFLQRAIGYSLTGDTGEQVLFVLFGQGANGKSVFIETIQGILGEDYAINSQAETVLSRDKQGGANPDVARLFGARFVTINEIPSNRRLDEGRIKELTGGDTVTARHLYKEHFSFKPEFKLFIRTNHKPEIRDTDNGIWRRMRIIPFIVTIPKEKRDPKLQRKLMDEWAGIMAWAVQGCLDWQVHGLGIPAEIEKATAEYKSEQDILGHFFDECCYLGSQFTSKMDFLYKAYMSWAEKNGEHVMTKAALGRELTQRGFVKIHDRTGSTYSGIGLKEENS